MFASLPMYDLPEVRAETDALWSAVAAALRARGIAAPQGLERGSASLLEDWLRPGLLLSQTCGLPFVRHLRDRVALVGGVHYDIPDCAPGAYRSRIVVRAGDRAQDLEALRGRVFAMNSEESQSGAGAMRALVARPGGGRPFFGRVVVTGSHLASLRAVAQGEADVAALDAVTFALASRLHPEARQVRVLLSTAETPGLPLITRAGGPAAALLDAVREGIEAVGPEVRAALLLRGAVERRAEDFDAIAAADRGAPPLG